MRSAFYYTQFEIILRKEQFFPVTVNYVDEMIDFKWSFVSGATNVIICCIFLACRPTIASTNSDTAGESSKLRTQVITTNTSAEASIWTSPSSYYDFVSHSKFFVDNSLLIKYVLQNPITLVTLARRFGKSLNIDMIKEFFAIEVDPTTNQVVPKNQTKAYQIFDSGILLTEDERVDLQPALLIKNNEKVMRRMNSFPVIHLNLGSPRQRLDSLEDICKLVVGRSVEAFKDHVHLRTLSTPAAMDYQKALSKLDSLDCAKDAEGVVFPLLELTSVLREHFGSLVIVLVDEYDAVLNTIFIESSYHADDYKNSAIKYFAHLFGTLLKNNRNVKTAVLTGIIPWKNSGIFSQFGQITIKTMADADPLEWYGMSPDNVKAMLKAANSDVLNDTAFSEMKRFYDGYLFGGMRKKFNPISVATFFNNHQRLDGYWTETGDIRFLLLQLIKFDDFNGRFIKLLLRDDISVSNDLNNFLQASFVDLSRLLSKLAHLDSDQWVCADDHEQMNVVFYALYASGYVTLSNRTTDSQVWLRIPNTEITRHLWKAYYLCLRDAGVVKQGPETSADEFERTMEAFSAEYGKLILTDQCDVKSFAEAFYQFAQTFPPYVRPGTKIKPGTVYLNEKLIESYVNDIHKRDFQQAHLATQRQFGAPKDKSYPGGIPDLISFYNETLVVIEFKCNGQSAEHALNQTKNYEKIFLNHKDFSGTFTKMKKVGLATYTNRSVQVLMQFGRLAQNNNTMMWDEPVPENFPKINK